MDDNPSQFFLRGKYKKKIPFFAVESLIGGNIPEAAHDGFKVVGSSFFTAEIPYDWQLEAIDGASMYWQIKKDGYSIGEIIFIPYFTHTESDEPEAGDGVLYASLYDETLWRRVLMKVSVDHADKAILNKITGSFKIIDGPYTSVDMKTAAQQYIRAGGREIFGKIEGMVFAEKNPVGILIKKMEFLHDDEAPNGFRIEVLSEVPVEYPVAPGANVLPLVPPSYNRHGTYYMPLLEDFIGNYDYEDFFYNFIVGADGEIKMILGRYIP
jgi:hypothetical protein